MISIIIATYNREALLRKGVMSILRQDSLPSSLEIVIVDDGSVDETRETCADLAEIARNKKIGFKYIYLDYPKPRISCVPRNVGIKQAKGDILIFTESEALHVGNTINDLLEELDRYPNNTILASQVWTTQRLIAEQLTEEEYARPEKILLHPYAQLTTSSNLTNTNAPNSDWAITGESNCNAGILFLTRKEWLIQVGGFDESFVGFAFDDFDLFNRLALTGHGIMKCSDIPVIHMWHDKSFYPGDIYKQGEANGKKSEANIHAGIYKVNDGDKWGIT